MSANVKQPLLIVPFCLCFLSELADGIGGTFLHNSNDLEGGLTSLVPGPEYLYRLEFSPEKFKPGGSYHRMKVKVNRAGLKVEARRGYFAPAPPKNKKQGWTPALSLSVEERLVFSRGEEPNERERNFAFGQCSRYCSV
jgi:hypothetical protein